MIKLHWCSNINALRACLPRCWTPQAGEPDLGPRTLTPVGEPLWYNNSPVAQPRRYGIWLYSQSTPPIHLMVLSLCLKLQKVFPSRFQSFSSKVVLQIDVILACSWQVSSESFYSAVLASLFLLYSLLFLNLIFPANWFYILFPGSEILPCLDCVTF